MRVLAWLALVLAGAAGLGAQALLLAASGIALGHASGAALGLAAFLAAWALGAGAAARLGPPTPKRLALAGLAQALLALVGTWLVLRLGATGSALPIAVSATLAAVGGVAFVQGLLFTWLAGVEERTRRGPRGDTAVVFGASLLGAALGAHFLAGELVGAAGRLPAALGAGGAGLVAGALGAWLAARTAGATERVPRADPPELQLGATLTAAQAAWLVGLGSAWLAANEWVGLRLAALWLGGMEPALRAGLTAALAALSVGAWIGPRLLPRGVRGVHWLLGAAAACSVWPSVLALVPAPGAAGGPWAALASAAMLVGPPLVLLGALVPVVQRAVRAGPERELGRLLVHEAWGAGLAVPLVHLAIVPATGLAGAVAFGIACGAAGALALARSHPRATVVVLLVALVACARVLTAGTLSRSAPPYRDPALTVLALEEDRDFAVAVVDDGLRGERTLFTDGFRAAGTGVEYRYMRVLGHLPLVLHPAPRSVAVLALGTGTTLGAVALHPEVERIDVLELSRAVVDAAPWFAEQNRGVLAQDTERVHVVLGDGRRALADRPRTYDVITMEPLLPDSPFGVYLYTREFYVQARRALRPGGLVCQWVPPHALEPATFDAVLASFASAFEWSGVWLAGTQVALIGADEEPGLDAARFAADGPLRTALVELGLADPAGVAARWIGSRPEADDGARARWLTDADPWVVYRPRRAGSVLLTDLPRNLDRLRSRRAVLPKAWTAVVGARGTDLRAGIAEVHRARSAHAAEEARVRGSGGPDARIALSEALELARRWAPGDPELLELEAEIEFLAAVRAGVSALAAGDAGAAERELARARALRPERADVAVYLATARERAGRPDARAELERAATLCPGIAATTAGERARTLGLSAASWDYLVGLAGSAGRTATAP